MSTIKDNLKNELSNFYKEKAISIGSSVYKIRIAAQGRGRSGGYRAYLFIMEVQGILTPICIYPKNRKENLGYNELTWHLTKTKEELARLV